nr:MAG TPA: hypothetical protein [Bacteriophage sp.]
MLCCGNFTKASYLLAFFFPKFHQFTINDFITLSFQLVNLGNLICVQLSVAVLKDLMLKI